MNKHKTKEIVLFKLKYPYGKPQVYLPTDLVMVASRLRSAGITSRIHDLNLHKLPSERNLKESRGFGVAVIGAPYISGSIELAAKLKETRKPIMIGGQVIEKLSDDQFRRLYGGGVVQAQNDYAIAEALDVSFAGFSEVRKTPLTPVLVDMDRDDLRGYLGNEFSLFTSQGCKFRCDFCAAQKRQPEAYRDIEVITQDIETLAKLAVNFGIRKQKIYLSSLDLFQTPEELAKVLEAFAKARAENNIDYELRCLSRVDSFLRAISKHPELKELCRKAGLKTIGFGVDGSTEKVWRSQHKGTVKLSETDKALEECKKLGIIPEILMVMGFPTDNLESLVRNYVYTISRAISHGAISRPYLAKPFVPGNKGWTDEQYQREVDALINNPEMFGNLDFAAFGSPLTHQDPMHRLISNIAYLAIIATLEPFGKNATYPLLPQIPTSGTLSKAYNVVAKEVNRLIPFDK